MIGLSVTYVYMYLSLSLYVYIYTHSFTTSPTLQRYCPLSRLGLVPGLTHKFGKSPRLPLETRYRRVALLLRIQNRSVRIKVEPHIHSIVLVLVSVFVLVSVSISILD